MVDEEFDALEGFFYVLEHGILELLENVEMYLHHLQVGCICSMPVIYSFDVDVFKHNNCISIVCGLN